MRKITSMKDLNPLELTAFSASRIDETYDFQLIRAYLDASISQAEQITGLALRRQIVGETIDLDRDGRATLRDTPIGQVRAEIDAGCAAGGCLPIGLRFIQIQTRGRELFAHCGLAGQRLRVEYQAGPASEAELMNWYPDIVAGIVALTTFQYEHRGDAAAMNAIEKSGALSHWQSRRSIVA